MTAGKKRIAVIPGDGIGKEVITQAVKVIEASGAAVAFTEFDWSADRYLRDGTTLPPDALTMLPRDFDAILFGAIMPKTSCWACASSSTCMRTSVR
jgi:isocitrate/isopropylmalate dehydrogenase